MGVTIVRKGGSRVQDAARDLGSKERARTQWTAGDKTRECSSRRALTVFIAGDRYLYRPLRPFPPHLPPSAPWWKKPRAMGARIPCP